MEAIPKIKICGLRTMQDVEIVNEFLPEFCGFIFDPTRRRYIDPQEAENLRRHLDPHILPVGVFVNASVEQILEVLRTCPVGGVQLHGQETDEYIDELRRALNGAPDQTSGRKSAPFIVKAFRIDTAEDMEQAGTSHADYVLLDHGIGGTGETFDWSLIRNCGRPFILAGGLNADNIRKAVSLTHPWTVDVSSSLETGGHKDREKVRKFVEAVRKQQQ